MFPLVVLSHLTSTADRADLWVTHESGPVRAECVSSVRGTPWECAAAALLALDELAGGVAYVDIIPRGGRLLGFTGRANNRHIFLIGEQPPDRHS